MVPSLRIFNDFPVPCGTADTVESVEWLADRQFVVRHASINLNALGYTLLPVAKVSLHPRVAWAQVQL